MPRAGGAPTYIAETLLQGLNKLTPSEQTAVKAAIFDLQVQPDLPSFQLHRVQAPDDGMWSARVDLDVRLILHKRGDPTVVCYADDRPTSAGRSPTCSTRPPNLPTATSSPTRPRTSDPPSCDCSAPSQPEGPDDVFLAGDAHHATRFVKRGDPTVLDCTFDEHTADVHDNRALRWTLHHASRAPNLLPSTRRSVGAL